MEKVSDRLKLLAFLLMFVIIPSFGASIRLSESPGRGKRIIEVGDIFYIYIEVSDLDGRPEVPSNVPGAKVMYFDHTGQSSRMSNINGKVTQSSSNTYTVTLRALKEGTFSFGPVTVGGVKSNVLRYSIGKASPQQQMVPGGNRAGSQQNDADDSKPKFIGKGDGNLFMRASVSETNVFEQQAIVYTVKLYTTYDAIKFIGATAAPKFEGFVTEESKAISNSLSFETYNGRSYATAVIARYIIFPQMTGQLKIIGNTYTVSVDQREYYHDPFFGNMAVSKPLQLNVSPNDLAINVKPLPSPKPADFSGGVGKFNISSQLKSKDFKTNQAGLIEYIVTGEGNLKYIQLPDLSTLYPPQLEIYTPTTDVKANVGASNVSGSVTYDYSFMPLEEGSFHIPEVRLVFFNPQTGKYETSVARAYDITVGRGSGSAKSQTKSINKFDSELKKVNFSSLKKVRTPYISGFGYWLWFIVPFVLLIVSFFVYRNYVKSHADLVALNSRRANKLARKRLKKAYVNMRKGDVDRFYDELLIALWGYLGDKLKMPTSELMRDNIRSVLESKAIPAEDIDGVIELLDRCEYAKYSPDSGKEGMNNAYESAISIINALERSFKKAKENEK